MNIRPMGVEVFLAVGQRDGMTDRCDEANNSLSQFCLRGEKYQTANKTTHILIRDSSAI